MRFQRPAGHGRTNRMHAHRSGKRIEFNRRRNAESILDSDEPGRRRPAIFHSYHDLNPIVIRRPRQWGEPLRASLKFPAGAQDLCAEPPAKGGRFSNSGGHAPTLFVSLSSLSFTRKFAPKVNRSCAIKSVRASPL